MTTTAPEGGSTSVLSNDFDFPMPKRETNWTISAQERAEREARKIKTVKKSNDVSDILGAQASSTNVYALYKLQNKPILFGTSDIAGASPTRLIPKEVSPQRRPQDRSIRCQDIEHSCPETKTFSTTRKVNPLEPMYSLPKVSVEAAPPPPLRHDPLRIDSVGHPVKSGIHQHHGHHGSGSEGTTRSATSPTRDNLNYSDVPFSTAGTKSSIRVRHNADNLALVTIPNARTGHGIDWKRHTNPVAPIYEIGRMEVKAERKKVASASAVVAEHLEGKGADVPSASSAAVGPTNSTSSAADRLPARPSGNTPIGPTTTLPLIIGAVQGSSPKKPQVLRKDRPLFSLHSDDIDGAMPTTSMPYPKTRRHWKDTCNISDIPTKKKSNLIPRKYPATAKPDTA